MSVTTSSTQTTITMEYNINYTVTVGVNTVCAGVQEATGTIYIGESGLGGRGSECSMCWSVGSYRHYLYR
jgi:hypothetical protein